MSQEIKDNELQSVTEEEEGEDSSQAGSELEIDKKKKEKKPLKSALKSKSKSKTSKKTKDVETKDTSKQKEKGLNRVSSVQTISSVVKDLDNLSQEISRTFYKTPNYSSHATQTSYQTPQFYNDQTPNMYHRAQAREEQYRNNFRDLNIESYQDHRRNDYENANRFFSQSVQPQQFDHSSRQREYQQEYLLPIQYQQEYLPPIQQQRMPMHYSQQFEQPYQEREHWNNDFYKSHTSFSSSKNSRDYRYESEYSAAPPSSQYQDYGYTTRDTFLSAPQKLDIRSLYKNKPKHIMMEQDSELRNGLRPNSLIRPPQTTQNYRTKSMIPSASAIHIHRGI